MKFTELNLDSKLQSAITNMGYADCTDIQNQAIPPIMEGKDVAGLSQTGTGKTAAFLIPLIERIMRSQASSEGASDQEKEIIQKRAFKDWLKLNFILVLVPTRELAEQVNENLNKLNPETGLRSVVLYGGTGYDKQIEQLKNGYEFLVATPGRLMDLYKENQLDFKQVRAVVFDEADRMFDMGFKDDMRFILQRVPRERQFLVFSATLNFDVLNTAYQYGAEPFEINISRDQTRAENVKDSIYHVGQEEKPQHLLSLLKKTNPKQAIIFTNFKHSVEPIAKFLNNNGIPAMAISSLFTQAQRNKVLEKFKAAQDVTILVATDVAARGLDVKGVDLVINFELPSDSETYVHRIGRTGRAGSEGTAYSLVSDKDVDSLMRIEEYLKHKLETQYIEDVDLVKDFKPYEYEARKQSYMGGRQGFNPKDSKRKVIDRKDFKKPSGGKGPRRHDERRTGEEKRFSGEQPNHRQDTRRGNSEKRFEKRSDQHGDRKFQVRSSGSNQQYDKKRIHGKGQPAGHHGHRKTHKEASVGEKIIKFFKGLFR